MKLFSWFLENMILDFDSAEAPEVYILQYIITAGYQQDVSHPVDASRLSAGRERVPRGDAFLFFILFMQHTQHTFLFFMQSYKSKKF